MTETEITTMIIFKGKKWIKINCNKKKKSLRSIKGPDTNRNKEVSLRSWQI